MKEIWRDIEGYEGLYQISNLGNVKSFKGINERILKASLNSSSYLTVSLCLGSNSKTCTVHRLVAKAFILEVDGKYHVNHINGVKTDNIALNLEWCTPKENIQHSHDTGLQVAVKGSANGKAKLKEEDIPKIFAMAAEVYTNKYIAKHFGVSATVINRVLNRKTWKHINIDEK